MCVNIWVLQQQLSLEESNAQHDHEDAEHRRGITAERQDECPGHVENVVKNKVFGVMMLKTLLKIRFFDYYKYVIFTKLFVLFFF